MRAVFSRRRNAIDLGYYDRKKKAIYIFLISHLQDARNFRDLIGLLNDTFLHEYLHHLLPKASEQAIKIGLYYIHKALGFD